MDQYQSVYYKIQPTMRPNVRTMSLTAAELVKIATNCFLTTKISYANMLGEVLIRSGLREDVDRALAAVGADSRVGGKYMRYGFGYGGPCLPRDNRAFAHYAQRVGLDFPLGTIVDEFNQDHTNFMVEDLLEQNTQGLAYWMPSLTYKPRTDIVEESQQLAVCEGLLRAGACVYVQADDLLPAAVRETLIQRWGTNIEFTTREELTRRGIETFYITL